MSEYRSQVQNMFLSTARKKHLPVEVVMNTGTILRGKIRGYDQFSITLTFKNTFEVIYKSSILFINLLPKKRKSKSSVASSASKAISSPPKKLSIASSDNIVVPKKPTKKIVIDEELDPPPPKKPLKRSI